MSNISNESVTTSKDLLTEVFEDVQIWQRADLYEQIILLLFGIFGNSMIVLITISNEKLHTTRAWLICSLAVSYLFFCIALVCYLYFDGHTGDILV
jgi:hypothetical protein